MPSSVTVGLEIKVDYIDFFLKWLSLPTTDKSQHDKEYRKSKDQEND